jgi:hypothetical protein
MAWMKKCTVTIFDGSKLRMNILAIGVSGTGEMEDLGDGIAGRSSGKDLSLECRANLSPIKFGADLPKVAK